MSRRAQFDAAYIERELATIGSNLDGTTTAYLIGGGSMALRGLKDATKDIDIVVDSNEAHDSLWAACTASGYTSVQSLDEVYRELGAKTVCDNDDGCRIEIFDRQVVNTLILSDGMKGRSEEFQEAGLLSVRLVSPNDIFLFKAVAKRADDIDDMAVLVQTGLDFDVIAVELRTQTELLGELQFVTDIGEALARLENEYGITLPLESEVDDLVNTYYDALEVWLTIDEPVPIEELLTELDIERTELNARLETLEWLDEIVVAEGTVYPVGGI